MEDQAARLGASIAAGDPVTTDGSGELVQLWAGNYRKQNGGNN